MVEKEATLLHYAGFLGYWMSLRALGYAYPVCHLSATMSIYTDTELSPGLWQLQQSVVN